MQGNIVKTSSVPYKKTAVIGFGLTGQSVIRYLGQSTSELIVMDTRQSVPDKKELARLFPKARLVTGGLDRHTLETADMVVVSPGVSIQALDLRNKINPRAELIGDIELFARYAHAPIIAITGSNGKSTVATIVDLMINAGGKTSALGGNIGIPALDLFEQPTPDVYVLELSSFQLETTDSLAADVAVVLNISEDHLDRYESYQDYIDAKKRIYRNAAGEVINRDEPTAPKITLAKTLTFGLSVPQKDKEFGLIESENTTWLARGESKILDVNKLNIKGQQNWLNVLASFALIARFGMNITQPMLDRLCEFNGLKDRCEMIANEGGVLWINDSKGTNVGATLAAIEGFDQPKIMIMGGQSKGADLSPLTEAINSSVSAVILLGEDAAKIKVILKQPIKTVMVETLEEAVLYAKNIAEQGEVVLFSPACASFDMFDNYIARGEAFRQLVKTHVIDEVISS